MQKPKVAVLNSQVTSLQKKETIAVDKQSFQQANQYLKHLKQINEEENIKIIRNRTYIAEALVLKTSTRLRHQARAEESKI